MTQAYGLLWERCSQAMLNKILTMSAYELTIKGDPMELLKAIKGQSLNIKETRNIYIIILEAQMNLLTCRQKNGKNLQDYTK